MNYRYEEKDKYYVLFAAIIFPDIADKNIVHKAKFKLGLNHMLGHFRSLLFNFLDLSFKAVIASLS